MAVPTLVPEDAGVKLGSTQTWTGTVGSVVWSKHGTTVIEYGVCARRLETVHRVHRCYIVVDELYSKSLAFQPARALLQAKTL
jgi:hypothetical protein